MLFEIKANKINDGFNEKTFYYDNMTNILKDADGNLFEYPEDQRIEEVYKPYKPFDKDRPLKKSKLISHLKIQMGLSCNYSCDYCSQKFVERQPETSKKDIDSFMEKLEALHFDEDVRLRVEFWGGEPLVYWKTLKPLAEAIAEKFSHWKTKPQFSIITNGSILTDEIIDWLMMMDFAIGISHDGPGQHVRGPDPFDDPEQKERILGLYRMMTRLGKSISFNSMLNSKNQSRKEIYDWFVNLTGDENVQLGEGSLVDAYDEEGISNSLITKEEHFEFRKRAIGEILASEGKIGFMNQMGKIDTFIRDVLSHKEAKFVGQKCGMDDEHTLAVDLRGNVMTCQNVSSLEISKNGESHHGGNLDDYVNVELKSSTHWSNRKECSECPVLHVCKGACMFLDEKFWDISCANAYSDNVVMFAAGFTLITNGYVPTLIKSDSLPLHRQDVFGTRMKHEEDDSFRKKIIQIKVVKEIIGSVNDIPVYGKSRVEQ
jgi:uncharacterized protein